MEAKDYKKMTLKELYAGKREVESQIAALKETQREIASVIEIKATELKVATYTDTERESLRQVLGKK